MSTTDFNRGSHRSPDEQPGSIGAGADIYRKLDRKPRGARWLGAIPFAVVAVLLSGAGLAAYVVTRPAAPPPPSPLLTTEQAVPANPPAVAVAPMAANLTPVEPARAAAEQSVPQRSERSHVAALAVRRGPRHPVESAVSSGEDANAYLPYTPRPQPAPSMAQSTMGTPSSATTIPPAAATLPNPAENSAPQPQS